MKVAQSCPTLCDPIDYTVHGILQGRILEWVAFPFSRGSSRPRDQTQVSQHCRWILYQLSHQGSPRLLEWVACPFQGNLTNPGIEPGSAASQADSLPAELPVKVKGSYDYPKKKKCYENVTNEGLGMNMYTLIYTELMIKKSVLNCTGKSTEHDVTTSVRKTTQKRINLYV